MVVMMMRMRKRSSKQEKEKNSKGIIRQIGKSKAKFNLQQAKKARTGRRGIVLIFLDPRPRYSCVVNTTPRPLCSRERDPGPIMPGLGTSAGLHGCGKYHRHRISVPGLSGQ
jgi:hypothetical protein